MASARKPEASTLDRKRGALIGLAIGDALGAAVEYMPPGSFGPVTGYRAGGPHGLRPGEWTDDTSMALALADSAILKWRDVEPGKLIEEFPARNACDFRCAALRNQSQLIPFDRRRQSHFRGKNRRRSAEARKSPFR